MLMSSDLITKSAYVGLGTLDFSSVDLSTILNSYVFSSGTLMAHSTHFILS